jgi:hypothetical protein
LGSSVLYAEQFVPQGELNIAFRLFDEVCGIAFLFSKAKKNLPKAPRGGKFGKTGVVFSPYHSRIVCVFGGSSCNKR